MLKKRGIDVWAIFLVFVVSFNTNSAQNISRNNFPEGFVFGTASSAYQFEGAVKEDGRGQTIWDKFSHTFGKVIDFSNGDVAVDQYHRYPEDIQLMKDMGMDAYRFSIAWARIFPNGTGEINQAGVDHYNKFINALLANAQGLGLPFLSPYLQSIGSDFRHGANFATAASTVLMPQTSLFVSGVSPFYLQVQLQQFKQFKVKVDELQSKENTNLPPSDIFGKSLYTFYISQNDFTGNLASKGIGGVKEYLPQVASQIANTIKEIYGLGGRTFLVLNLAPIGCYPAFLAELPHESSDIDEFGCMTSYNNAVVDYNNMLKDALAQTRKDLSDANVIYVDTHAVLLELFQHPTSHGLQYGNKACCGQGGGSYNFNQEVPCGNTKEVNGQTLSATACEDPYNYVSWDGIHATEAANKITANVILNDGSNFDPPFSLHKFCDIQPIG